MASVRLEMAFIWSSELAERPLAFGEANAYRATTSALSALSCGRKFSTKQKNRASVHRHTRMLPQKNTSRGRGLTQYI